MSTFNDTRHVIDGDTGGGTDDTTAYNDVLASGSTLTFTSINGDQKSVSVTGGAGTFEITPVFTSEGRAVGVGSDENAAPCLPLTRASKTRPIAHAVAPFA